MAREKYQNTKEEKEKSFYEKKYFLLLVEYRRSYFKANNIELLGHVLDFLKTLAQLKFL